MPGGGDSVPHLPMMIATINPHPLDSPGKSVSLSIFLRGHRAEWVIAVACSAAADKFADSLSTQEQYAPQCLAEYEAHEIPEYVPNGSRATRPL